MEKFITDTDPCANTICEYKNCKQESMMLIEDRDGEYKKHYCNKHFDVIYKFIIKHSK